MGTQTYVYKGQEYVLNDKYSQDEAIAKIKSIAEPQVQQDDTESHPLTSDLQTLGNLVSSGIGSIVGGVAGASKYLTSGGDINQAVDTLHNVSNALTYEPTSEEAKQKVQKISSLLQSAQNTLGEATPNVIAAAPFVGEDVYNQLAADPNKMALAKELGGGVAMNFLPLDIVGRTIGKGAELAKGLKRTEVPEVSPLENLDRVSQQEAIQASPDVPRMTQEQADAYYAQRNAQRPMGPNLSEAPGPTPEEINQGFLQDQQQRRAELEQQQAQIQGPAAPPTSDLEAAIKNREYLDELQQQREAQSQANVGPQPPTPEEAVAQKNADFVNQFHAEVEQRAQARDIINQERQAQVEAENKARDDALAQRQATYQQQQTALLQQAKEARPQVGLSTGEFKPGGSNVTRPTTVDSGIMGGKPNEPFGSIAGKFVPKSQRGGIDFDALSKGLSRVFGKDKSPISNIPGHENTVGSMITDYSKPADILSNVMQHGSDVKLINQNYRAGMSNTYAFTNHPLFRQVADLFQTAAKRTDSQIKQFVQPAEHNVIQLQRKSPKEFTQLGKLFMKELSEKKTYSVDDLTRAGFTPRQIGAYQSIRDMFKAAAKRQNEILAEKGLPQMTESEHYLASRRVGDYHQYFYDKQGRLVWMTRDLSKGDALKAKTWIHQNVPEIDPSKTNLEVKKTTGAVEDPAASFSSMLLRFGDEPIAQKIKEAMIAKDTATGIKAFQQFQHFKNKAGIRGFEGDKPWVSDTQNAKDLLSQQIHYAKNAFAWSELNKANGVASEVLRNPDLIKKFPNTAEHAQAYADRYMGKEGQVFKNLDSWLGQRLGGSGASFRKYTSAFKQLWTSQKMLTNTGNYIQNTLQPTNTIPFHMMLSDRGFTHDVGKTFALTAADTLGGMAEHYGNKLGVKNPTKAMTELGRAATKYAEDNFILDLSPFDEHQSVEQAHIPGISQTAQVARDINQITNKSANFAAFMSFVHHLDQSGKFPNRMELFKEAEHWMNASMVDPRAHERPFIVQDTGALGSLAAGLQSYAINKYNSLGGFIDHGVKTGNWAPFGTAITMDMAMAGVKGFIPLATYMTIADYINQKADEDILPDPRKAIMDLGDKVGEVAGQFGKDVVSTG
ncbi:MAG TPA: hypothetical protein VFM18_15210, partial [Methanosarcina sp.]|nr:hypothetical protein [Methanosarcina sp.]